MTDQKPVLTEKQFSRFGRDGFLKIPQLADPDQVRMLKTRVQELEQGEGDDRITRQVEPEVADTGDDAPLRKFHRVAVYDAVFQDYLTSGPVRNTLASILGPDFLIYSDIVFMKPALVGSRQPYHQDRVLGYHIDDGAAMVGLWLALDPADEENGCLRFLPGSHKVRLTRDDFAWMEERALSGQLMEEVLVPADPGDAILLNSLILHASEPNRSGRNRWAYSAFCVSCDAVFTGEEGRKPPFFVVQGARKPGRI